MKPEDLDALDRRNNVNTDVIAEQLKNINGTLTTLNKTVESNDRAIRGFNGKPGMVGKIDKVVEKMDELAEQPAKCEAKFAVIGETLHGKGHENIGVVGEQNIIKRLNKWLIGIATSVLISSIVLLIKITISS